ncbi:MAG: HPr family phosphocarrier protein [Planctomycetaceae bacterium]|nr:HPr family phosphocarrier protein [Planctomycetaceae bacterium]
MTAESPHSRNVSVKLENGLHLVPCSRIAELVRDFPGTVWIRREEQAVDAKSIFDLLTLQAPFGTVLTLEASGNGADHIIEGLAALFERNFELE